MASPNRLITLDTETTGLDAQNGDRIIEIGCGAIEGRMICRFSSIRNARYLKRPSPFTALRRNTCRTSRSLPKSPISSLIL